MKLFVWERIERASTAYHCAGGLVVIACDEARARTIVAERFAADVAAGTDEYGGPSNVPTLREDELPDDVRADVSGPEAVWVFPDAGCC